MKAHLTSALVVSVAALFAAVGCGEEQPAAPGGAADTGVLPSEVGAKIGDAVSGAADKLNEQYASQLDTLESKLGSLKTSAQSLGDDKLNELIGTIDDKVAAARGKLDELKGADAGAAQKIGGELKTAMGDVQKLYEQAMQRVTELKGGELPGGVKLPGS